MKKANKALLIIISIFVLLILSFIFYTNKANDYAIETLKQEEKIPAASEEIREQPVIITGTIDKISNDENKLYVLSGEGEERQLIVDKDTLYYDIEKRPAGIGALKTEQAVKVQILKIDGVELVQSLYIIGEQVPKSDLSTEPGTAPATPAKSTASDQADTKVDIRLSNLAANQKISSPLLIDGEVAGSWYFEGIFTVVLQDSEGVELARQNAEAIGDWMTTDLVPFNLKLEFKQPASKTGKLIFQKSNPSGLPQNEASFVLPVKF